MSRLEFVYQNLGALRQVFPRDRTFVVFCAVVLGFIATSKMDGVSSLCRLWEGAVPGYRSLLHFFASSGWSAATLALAWERIVLAEAPLVRVNGRAVQVGDHSDVVKDGRQMPGVVTLYQESETQSKPSYFRGHHWGALGLLVGAPGSTFCVPLAAQIHQGFAHLGESSKHEGAPETLASRVVLMALEVAMRRGLPSYLVLDAFFSVGSVFKLANSCWSVAVRAPYLHIVTRAKKSYVGYDHAPVPEKPGPGRPAKYGEKIRLWKVFKERREKFESLACNVYGKSETILCYAVNLLWKPIGGDIRFIFAITSRGPIILMSSDLTLDACLAVAMYCHRTRIETLFWVLKHVIGAFSYHFWSKFLPRHSRRPKKNSQLRGPNPDALPLVRARWEACERFVQCALIATGMLQLIALKYSESVWQRFTGFLRTRSRTLPSERTVKLVLAQELLADFHGPAPSATMREIREVLTPPPKPEQIVRAVA